MEIRAQQPPASLAGPATAAQNQLSPPASAARPPAVPDAPASKPAREPLHMSRAEFQAFRKEVTPILNALTQGDMSAAAQKSAGEQLNALFDQYMGDARDGAEREAKLQQFGAIALMQSRVLATRELFAIRNAKMDEWYKANPPSKAQVGAVVHNPYADYVDPKNREGLAKQQAFLTNWVSDYARAHRIEQTVFGGARGLLVDTTA